jgi:hypothetical protein
MRSIMSFPLDIIPMMDRVTVLRIAAVTAEKCEPQILPTPKDMRILQWQTGLQQGQYLHNLEPPSDIISRHSRRKAPAEQQAASSYPGEIDEREESLAKHHRNSPSW